MLLDDLPNDCLLLIFGFIGELKDLINCYQVSKRWRDLTAVRTKNVKYLFRYPQEMRELTDSLYFDHFEPYNGLILLKLLPNLRVVDIASGSLDDEDEISYLKAAHRLLHILRFAEHLKGLIDVPVIDYDYKINCCPNIEILTLDRKHNSNNMEINRNVKQIIFPEYSEDVSSWLPIIFPNVERIQAVIKESDDERYHGPVFENLRIIELDIDASASKWVFQLMDYCPALESAYISITFEEYWDNHLVEIFDDVPIVNEKLKNLVLSFYADPLDWNQIRKVLHKYPSLENLAIRGHRALHDVHIEELLSMLSKLKQLDVRGCNQITQKTAKYVQNFCERYNRSIKFHYNEDDNTIDARTVFASSNFIDYCFDSYVPRFLDPIG